MNDPRRTAAIETSLESVLSTGELSARPSRPPDYETENRALLAIAQNMADSPRTALQKLAEVALEICGAGSAGVSLLSEESGDFYWPAIAGAWKPHIGGGTPRDFGPCGVVLDRNAVQLFTHPERYYPYLIPVSPPIAEALLTPFYVGGKAFGTVWVIAHDEARHFDAEDLRLIESLGRFAAAAWALRAALDAQKQQSASMRDMNEALLVSSVRQHELTDQAQKGEAALRESEERLASELTAMQRLQKTSTQLIGDDNVEALYEQILDTAIVIMHSDMASVQVLDESGNALRMLAFRGFDSEFGKTFALNGWDRRTSCGVALREGHRVVVADVETCDFNIGTPALEDQRKTGIRAVQSTPLVSRGGSLLGVISTHWRNPHQPAERDLRLLDVLARQTADLIERTRSEGTLRESEERFRTLVSVITDVPWTTNPEGRFVAAQPAWAAYTGQSWEEIKDFGWANALHPDDRPVILEGWQRACAAHALYRSQGRIWHAATRRYRHFEARATPVLNQDGSVREWVGSCTDVQEQKRAEEQLRRTQRLESIGVLAGGIAHDFNNLLAGILGNASLALDMLPPAHLLRDLLDDVVHFSQSAAQLTQQMLAYAGQGQFLKEFINLSDLVRKSSSLIQASIPRTVQLRLELQNDLPAVEADTTQLQQLIMNLVINGAEAIGKGETGEVRVTTTVQKVDEDYLQQILNTDEILPGQYVLLEVCDTGCGMDEETKAKIFDPFFTTKFVGRGLGLAAALGIVRGHKGTLNVNSTLGKGSTFRVLFPALAVAAVEQGSTARNAAELSGRGVILVVDDEAAVRRTAQTVLQRYGYTVLLAENGLEAVEIFRNHSDEISVVLLDLTMPVMSGEETLKQLQTQRPDVRVVLSSGYDQMETSRRFQAKGLAAFIHKPYTAAELAEKIKIVSGEVGLQSASIIR